MATDDFFRARLDQMIDMSHPLVVLARRMPWAQIEASLAPHFARSSRPGKALAGLDLFGPSLQLAGTGFSAAGRPRLPIRQMAALLYLEHAFGLSDEEVAKRWSENVVWQYFCGQEFKRAIVDTTVQEKAIAPPGDCRQFEPVFGRLKEDNCMRTQVLALRGTGRCAQRRTL